MFPFTKKNKGKKDSLAILEFEKPLVQLAGQISELEETTYNNDCKLSVNAMKVQLEDLKNKIYSNLTPPQILQIARHPNRPYTLDYVKYLKRNWLELHGDREGHDDGAIVGGLLELDNGQIIMIVGTDKGRGIKDKQKRNFGMPQPWGYRKALRLFKHAERFNIPIVTLIDTPGAYPGLEAEAQGQSRAIAQNIQEMSMLKVPIISIITGEGGSGGALALGVANKVLMLQYSVYSVISPEGCAAILWRNRDFAAEAASKLKITANELKELKLIDDIVSEPLGGAHHDHEGIALNLQQIILKNLKELKKLSSEELILQRQEKYRNYGFYNID